MSNFRIDSEGRIHLVEGPDETVGPGPDTDAGPAGESVQPSPPRNARSSSAVPRVLIVVLAFAVAFGVGRFTTELFATSGTGGTAYPGKTVDVGTTQGTSYSLATTSPDGGRLSSYESSGSANGAAFSNDDTSLLDDDTANAPDSASTAFSPSGGSLVNDPSQTGSDGYVLPQSDTHLYTESELSGLDLWGLCVARNEIPGRHGFIFDRDDLTSYFAGKTWYKGTLTRKEFQSIAGILNETEEANVATILAMEKRMGSPYVPSHIDPFVADPDNVAPDGYVLPQSDTHKYTKSELSALDDWGLSVARNEIPARHGLIFDPGETADYFAGKTWYEGTLTRKEFRSIVGILNEVEEANVATILEIEEQRNSPYTPEG